MRDGRRSAWSSCGWKVGGAGVQTLGSAMSARSGEAGLGIEGGGAVGTAARPDDVEDSLTATVDRCRTAP